MLRRSMSTLVFMFCGGPGALALRSPLLRPLARPGGGGGPGGGVARAGLLQDFNGAGLEIPDHPAMSRLYICPSGGEGAPQLHYGVAVYGRRNYREDKGSNPDGGERGGTTGTTETTETTDSIDSIDLMQVDATPFPVEGSSIRACCHDYFLFRSISPSGSLTRSISVLAAIAMGFGNVKLFKIVSLAALVTPTEAVCPHCKDTIPGCAGHEACPTVADVVANAAIFSDHVLGSTPRVTNLFPPELAAHFSRPLCEAIVGIACAPAPGREVDFSSESYASNQAVVRAAQYGHCSVAEAASVLAQRLEEATEDIDMTKIKGAIDSLKLVSDSVVSSTRGVLSFLWAKVSVVVSKRADAIMRLDTDVGKVKPGTLTTTLTRPNSEGMFYEMLHYFLIVITGLGLVSYVIASRFVDDVVYGAMRLRESWQVAHELLLVYLRECDYDHTRTLTLANVFRRGGQDTFMSEARANAAAFFRPGAGTARPGGGELDDSSIKKHNGKFTASSQKPCNDFNSGKPCSRLLPDGTCKFNHVCNQFVTDKGPGGRCLGNHARCNGCTYPESKRCAKAATE